MNSKKLSEIALIGISAHEMRVLQTICLISRSRPQTYALQEDAASGTADIAIVDQDNPRALIAWKNFQANNPDLPAIMLTRHPGTDPSLCQLGRPLMATRLLKILDQTLATNESPAFTPAQESESNVSTLSAKAKAAQRSTTEVEKNTQQSALVVDDSLPVRRQIGIHLAPLVGKVDFAEDGERALELIANRTYDIIFLDVVLPGMDGYKICRVIKKNKKTKKTPVIMLTGKSSPFDMVKGKLAGCDTYLTKPVEDTTFDEVVQKYLNKWQPSESDEERNKNLG